MLLSCCFVGEQEPDFHQMGEEGHGGHRVEQTEALHVCSGRQLPVDGAGDEALHNDLNERRPAVQSSNERWN